MPLRIAVIGTSAGQGSTTYGLGLAWSAARDRTVRLIDADPAVGTVQTVLDLDTKASIENAFGPYGVPASGLDVQSVDIPGRRGLRVVPGFRRWEFSAGQILSRLGPTLPELRDDVVIVDAGCPFAPADPGTPTAMALLAQHFDAVLLVMRAQADVLERSLRLLDGVSLSRVRPVIVRPAHRREMRSTLDLLRQHLPALPTPVEWDWDPARIVRRDVSMIPFHRAGMLEETGLAGGGRLVDVTELRGFQRFRRRRPAA